LRASAASIPIAAHRRAARALATVHRRRHPLLARELAADAARLGWDAYDLFGCDRDKPIDRVDKQARSLMGVGRQSHRGLAEDTATIETGGGVRHTWRRKPGEPGLVLAWELVP
jgi:hypothetical protein